MVPENRTSSNNLFLAVVISTFIALVLMLIQLPIWLFYLWPFIFAYSRIYVGVHYPIDILVGTTFGILAAFLFYGVYKKSKYPA